MHKTLLGIASVILAIGVLFIAFTYYENSKVYAENSKINAARLELEVYKEAGIKEYNVRTGEMKRLNGKNDYQYSPHPKKLKELILDY